METLNQRSFALCQQAIQFASNLGIEVDNADPRQTILDFGVTAEGSLDAGLMLAKICWADLGQVHSTTLDCAGQSTPAIQVRTSDLLRACMASQYAGWQISVDKFFAMCSGPIRATHGREKFFEMFGLTEASNTVVGVLETSRRPTNEVFDWLRERLPKSVDKIVLCVARTRSIAGRTQIVARSIETACHKLFELGFDLRTLKSGEGVAPLPPSTCDDLEAMGSTNDAILLAAKVKLLIDADDATIDHIGPQIPSCSSAQFGRPFAELFAAAGGDFYRMDPALFAPAEITLQSTRSGLSKTFGKSRLDLYLASLK